MEQHFIIADDFPLTLLGTQVLLDGMGHHVLGSYNNGLSAWNAIQKYRPSFVILDISMPEMDGIDVAEAIRDAGMETKIILLTSHKEKSIFQRADELSINAYLLKQYALEELEECINQLSKPNVTKYVSPKLKYELEADVAYLKGETMNKLTFSEKKIFELIIAQKTTKEIAGLLFLSEKTIEAHRAEIIRKLAITPGKNALLKYAAQFQQ